MRSLMVGAAILVALVPFALGAQRRDDQVHVALVRELAQRTLRAEVVRFDDADGRTVILLREGDATEADLIAALAMAEQLRSVPVPAGGSVRAAVAGHSAAVDTPPIHRAKARALMTRLRSTPRTQIGSLGTGRWLTTPSTL